jgi:L-threonylcarbamoyladenylate synthase
MNRVTISPSGIEPAPLKQIGDVLLNGGIVALPTETVYGLAVLPTHKSAVEKLYAIKKRDRTKPFTLCMGNVNDALSHFLTLPPYGYRLIENFWPGPLTIIYYSDNETKVGIRIPLHPCLQTILNELNQPVFLPSANISGQKEATSADEVEEIFGTDIDLIIDGGSSVYGTASTVIDLTFHPFKLIREGVVSLREIVEVFIRKRLMFVCTGNTCRSVLAEYLLKKYLGEYDHFLLERYEILSSGTAAPQGNPPADSVTNILKSQERMDPQPHRATQINRAAILSSDLIFPMEDRQQDYILKVEPTAEPRIIPLKKFLPEELGNDIPDPIGKPDWFYQNVYGILKQAIMELREWL